MQTTTLKAIGLEAGRTLDEQVQQIHQQGVSVADVARATGLRANARLSPADLARSFSHNSTGPELAAVRRPNDAARDLDSPRPALPVEAKSADNANDWLRKKASQDKARRVLAPAAGLLAAGLVVAAPIVLGASAAVGVVAAVVAIPVGAVAWFLTHASMGGRISWIG